MPCPGRAETAEKRQSKWKIKQNGCLPLSDKLFEHCAEIDEAARNRIELIVRSLAEQNGVTEKLKAENQMEWVWQMNACKAVGAYHPQRNTARPVRCPCPGVLPEAVCFQRHDC